MKNYFLCFLVNQLIRRLGEAIYGYSANEPCLRTSSSDLNLKLQQLIMCLIIKKY